MLQEKKKQKRTAISELLKKEICVYYQENDKKTHKEIADYFSEKKQLTIDRSTITKILSDKEKWINISSSTHYNIFLNN
jgi:restriction endonuclease